MAIKIQGDIMATTDIERTTVIEDICSEYGYEAEIFVDDIPTPNPESKTDFVMRKLSENMVDLVNDIRVRTGFEEVRNSVVRAELDTD